MAKDIKDMETLVSKLHSDAAFEAPIENELFSSLPATNEEQLKHLNDILAINNNLAEVVG